MFQQLKNIINCCIKPNNENALSSIEQEIIENQVKSTNDYINNNSKSSISFNKSLKEEKKRLNSKISNNSNKSNITFSNQLVKQNIETKRSLDTLIISTHEIELDGEIFFNKCLIIDRIGLKKLGRKNQNGKTIFGICNNENYINSGIDFNLNISRNKLKNINNNENNIPLFSIEYNKIEEHYILRLLNFDIKIFLFIDYNFLIENNTTNNYMIGKVPLTISSPKNENDNIFTVLVKGKKYEFNKIKDCPITIGRTNAKINIKNNSISKLHAIIDYQFDNQVISIKDNDSTNGTYFNIDEKSPFVYLLSDLTFKILDNKFSVHVIYN